MRAADAKRIARDCGFELAGIAASAPSADAGRYREWVSDGLAGRMGYLTGRRADVRMDPRNLLQSVRSVICVGKLYNTDHPRTDRLACTSEIPPDNTIKETGWISRYAWGSDYHGLLGARLRKMAGALLAEFGPFEYKICVDTAPLLERSYARMAGLGWIGKNTCLINQQQGSWFFLGEILLSLELEPDSPPPDRCGSCTRCIDACPTQAIAPYGDGYRLDPRACISYLTIELKGTVDRGLTPAMGHHIFGCDICQDVCPWNHRAPATSEPAFQPSAFAPALAEAAGLSEAAFRERFADSPLLRAKHSGFLRNVAIAMGNSRNPEFRSQLETLSRSNDVTVAQQASWALARLAGQMEGLSEPAEAISP